jgi:hypothetical protein
MSLAKLLNQPLELSRRNGATLDEYGNQVTTFYSEPTTVLGYLEQKDSTEFLQDRDTIVSTWTAYLPADTLIGPFDRIGFSSQTFEVDGAPWPAYNPRVRTVSHIVCKLKVVQ